MKKCAIECFLAKENHVENKECRLHIDYPEEDLNCSSVAVSRNMAL
jgi:hypothetical protein